MTRFSTLLSTQPCDSNNPLQRWAFDRNKRFVNSEGLCLNMADGDYTEGVNADECRLSKTNQQWYIYEGRNIMNDGPNGGALESNGSGMKFSINII